MRNMTCATTGHQIAIAVAVVNAIAVFVARAPRQESQSAAPQTQTEPPPPTRQPGYSVRRQGPITASVLTRLAEEPPPSPSRCPHPLIHGSPASPH